MASVEADDVVKLLREFLDTTSGERFAITNQSLLDFTSYVSSQLDAGAGVSSLTQRARGAREFAIRSALNDRSTVDVGARTMPLVREKDASLTIARCDNFGTF